MKTKLLTFILLLFVVMGCKKNDEDAPKIDSKSLTETSQFNFTANEDAQLLLINTKLDWRITSSANWIRFTAASGKGNSGILVGASTNSSLPRKAIITLVCDTGKIEIPVVQAGAPRINITLGNQNIKMILVEAGKFTMGDPDLNSFTLHEVQLDSFYISETEITNAVWKDIQGNLPYDTIPTYTGESQLTKTNLPVSYVSWNEINTQFLAKLKIKTGYNFRLPTEAEWEYAAIGGKYSKNYKYAGSNDLATVAWYTDSNLSSNTGGKKEVKTLVCNELGLYDMSGNVSEWCGDWYADYTAETIKNPTGPAIGTKKVVRGGNYLSYISWGEVLECKTRYRNSVIPICYEIASPGTSYEAKYYRCECLGFRIVLAIE